jgi:hypothetical protein
MSNAETSDWMSSEGGSVFGRRDSRRSTKPSELASVLDALGDMWNERPGSQTASPSSSLPSSGIVARDPDVNVVSLAGRQAPARRDREVAQAS